jgi:hypothetical protein
MRFLLAALLALATPAFAVVNYPASLDDNTTLYNVTTGSDIIADHHNQLKDAVIALETAVGITGSLDTSSIVYKLTNSASLDPGHTHSSSGVAFGNGTVSAPTVKFSSDTNTGWFRPAGGSWAYTSGGVEIARLSATGLGIGLTPNFALDVAGTARITGSNDLCFGGTGGADNDTCMDRDAAHVLRVVGNAKLVDQATTDNSLVLQGIAAKTGEFFRIFLNTTDTQPILEVTEAGVIQLGAGGASAPDVTLYRSAANTLKTDDSLTIDGTNVTLTNDGSAAQNIVAGTTNGLKIGTATSQKLGLFNATPVVQPTASAGLLASLQALGLIASGTFSGDIITTGTTQTGGLIGAVQSIALVNGANNNVAVNAGTTHIRITGPTGAFNITGFAVSGGNTDGRVLTVVSTVSQTLTWTNDLTSTAANRILTQTLADVACNATEPASATFVYDGTTTRWRAVSYVNCTNP